MSLSLCNKNDTFVRQVNIMLLSHLTILKQQLYTVKLFILISFFRVFGDHLGFFNIFPLVRTFKVHSIGDKTTGNKLV